MSTRTTEIGNLYVGDVIVLPGDLEGIVTEVRWIAPADAHQRTDLAEVHTNIGNLLGVHFGDTVEVITCDTCKGTGEAYDPNYRAVVKCGDCQA